MMDDEEADLREQIFHNNVREQIVSKAFVDCAIYCNSIQ